MQQRLTLKVQAIEPAMLRQLMRKGRHFKNKYYQMMRHDPIYKIGNIGLLRSIANSSICILLF